MDNEFGLNMRRNECDFPKVQSTGCGARVGIWNVKLQPPSWTVQGDPCVKGSK